jgi:hypothetical protein
MPSLRTLLRLALVGAAVSGAALSPASDASAESAVGPAASELSEGRRAKSWIVEKPDRSTQHEKPASERGVNPCATPDPGFGVYGKWDRAPSMGQMIVPERGGLTKAGEFDVMIHFHGHEPARKEWVKVMDGAVLVGIDLGVGSGAYEKVFQDPAAFSELVESVERGVAKSRNVPRARARKIGLSAWSAGYGAIQYILSQPKHERRIDAVVLLDGLHSGYQGDSLNPLQLAPFVAFARKASAGDRFMFVSHSSIVPPGYASTTETARYLIAELGGRPRSARPRSSDPMGLELIGRYSQGNFHVRGYSGNGKLDHCAHLGLFADVLRVHVKPRWRTPRGSSAR